MVNGSIQLLVQYLLAKIVEPLSGFDCIHMFVSFTLEGTKLPNPHSRNLILGFSPTPIFAKASWDDACDDPICGASQKRKGETDDTLASVGSIRREIKFNLSFSWVVGKEILPQKKED